MSIGSHDRLASNGPIAADSADPSPPDDRRVDDAGEGRLVSSFLHPARSDIVRLAILVFAVALGARLAYTIALGWRGYQPVADAQDYNLIAQGITGGKGFARLGYDLAWKTTAFRPPLTPYFIAAIYRFSPANVLAGRIAMCVVGAITCVLVFFLGAVAFPGERRWKIGIIAGLGSALYPFLIIHSTSLLIEPIHVLLICALALVMLAVRRPIRNLALVWIGALTGLIALNRPDGMAYALMAAIWAATIGLGNCGTVEEDERSEEGGHSQEAGSERAEPEPGRVTLGRRLRAAGIVIAVFVAVMSPWWIRNAVAFHTFIPSTTSTGDLVLGANNESTYHPGVFYGYWNYFALVTGEAGAYGFADEVTADNKHLSLGIDYIKSHPAGYVAVMPIRVLRGWELWDPVGNARFGTSWGRPIWAGLAGLVAYYPILVLAIVGMIGARRRWRDLAPLYVLPIYITILFAVFTGEMRYRAGIEPILIVFASSGIYLCLDAARRRRARTSQAETALS